MSLQEKPQEPGRERSFSQLFIDATREMSTLTRTEVALAKAEISDRISKASTGLALLAVAAAIVMPAIVILLQAAVRGVMAAGVYQGWASFAIGGGTFIIGAILALMARGRLKADALAPDKTIEELRRDAELVREETKRHDHDKQRAA